MPVEDAVKIQKALGQRIKRLREQEGWSQEALADLCGMARGQLEQIERGQIDLRVGMLAEIAGKLKTTVTQLLQGVA